MEKIARKAPYESRYRIIFWLIVIFFIVDGIGFAIIDSAISEKIACQLSDNYWFMLMWPTNILNGPILGAAPAGNLDACRVIAATSWSACVGITLFFVRVLFELRFNERRNLLGLRLPLYMLLGGLFILIPSPINPTVIEYGRTLISINIHFPRIISEFELIGFSFLSFFCLSECVAGILIYARSKIDAGLR